MAQGRWPLGEAKPRASQGLLSSGESGVPPAAHSEPSGHGRWSAVCATICPRPPLQVQGLLTPWPSCPRDLRWDVEPQAWPQVTRMVADRLPEPPARWDPGGGGSGLCRMGTVSPGQARPRRRGQEDNSARLQLGTVLAPQALLTPSRCLALWKKLHKPHVNSLPRTQRTAPGQSPGSTPLCDVPKPRSDSSHVCVSFHALLSRSFFLSDSFVKEKDRRKEKQPDVHVLLGTELRASCLRIQCSTHCVTPDHHTAFLHGDPRPQAATARP